jgi:hypothetical protein
MKKIFKNKFFKIFLFIFIGILIFVILSNILLPEWVTNGDVTLTMRGFYNEPKNSIDVVFVGDSNVYRGVSPMVIWEDSGITSYTYSTPEQSLYLSYYLLKEYFTYQNPKIVMLDINEAFNSKDMQESNIRKAFDNMKLSQNKIDAMNDPVFNLSDFDKLSCFFPILRYHSRWDKLNWNDLKRLTLEYDSIYKGYLPSKTVKAYHQEVDYMEENDNVQITDRARYYLEKIIELCNENNSELVLMKIPCIDTWSLDRNVEMQQFANEHNLKFVDMNLENTVDINWDTDSEDAGDHLNIYGAEKVSEYLNNYLVKNFSLKDYRQDENYASWNSDLEKYKSDVEAVKNN